MATTDFTNAVTLTDAEWFNDTDYVVYDGSASQMLVGAGPGTRAVWSPFAASQAQQETATSTAVAVTPGRQQFHPSAAKAWAYFDSGTTISASYNVTSITDGGSGQATVNLTTSFSSVNFVAVAMANYGATLAVVQSTLNSWSNSGQVLLQALDDAGAATDVSHFNMVAFGDQ